LLSSLAVPASADSLWMHNDSIMRLRSEGSVRSFEYVQPRSDLRAAGVKVGTVLFTGKLLGERTYAGTAFRFSSRCGPISYTVEGTMVGDRSLTLKGRLPKRNRKCAVVGYRQDVLVFSLLQSAVSDPDSEGTSKKTKEQPADPIPKPELKPKILKTKANSQMAALTNAEPVAAEADSSSVKPPPTGTEPTAALQPPVKRLKRVATPAECLVELARLGVDFSVPKEIEVTDICSIQNPVQLRSVKTSTGNVKFSGNPILDCEFARKFATWVSYVAAPLVGGLATANLSSILAGTSYQCRRRNGDNSDKMSEHAFGNAIDIAGFTLNNKRKIDIAEITDSRDQRLLMALRTSACGYFTTVLGPGSNAAHASHYHFDLIKRGKSGTSRICE
jgi:hypothetical protein